MTTSGVIHLPTQRVSGIQIPGDLVRWCLVFVDPKYGTCCISPFWRLEFWGRL